MEWGPKEVQIRIRVIGGELYGALLKTVARGSPKLPPIGFPHAKTQESMNSYSCVP